MLHEICFIYVQFSKGLGKRYKSIFSTRNVIWTFFWRLPTPPPLRNVTHFLFFSCVTNFFVFKARRWGGGGCVVFKLSLIFVLWGSIGITVYDKVWLWLLTSLDGFWGLSALTYLFYAHKDIFYIFEIFLDVCWKLQECLSVVNGWKLIHYEKMKTAEEKFPEGLNIFIAYFKLKCFEYNMIFRISGCIYVEFFK